MAKKADATGMPMDGFFEAMTDKLGEVDVRFENVELRWKGTPLGLELNGGLSMSIHFRDLSEDEKRAHIRVNLGRMRSK
jgi:hypothetical protein